MLSVKMSVVRGLAGTLSVMHVGIFFLRYTGTVEYYYAKADTWHTTCPGGIEVYHFPSGQTEAHHPGDMKEIIFPDGSMRLVQGRGADIDADLDLLSDAVKRGRPAMSQAGQ